MPEIIDNDRSHNSDQRGGDTGEMHARREKMEDGRRYIVYYTFGELPQERPTDKPEGASENV